MIVIIRRQFMYPERVLQIHGVHDKQQSEVQSYGPTAIDSKSNHYQNDLVGLYQQIN